MRVGAHLVIHTDLIVLQRDETEDVKKDPSSKEHGLSQNNENRRIKEVRIASQV